MTIEKNNLNLWFYANYEYEKLPLAFVKLSAAPLTADTIVELLRRFDLWYGSTNQDTTDWALEFQVLTRALINDGALLVNPYYLDLEPVIDELYAVLKAAGGNAEAEYRSARAIPETELIARWKEEEG